MTAPELLFTADRLSIYKTSDGKLYSLAWSGECDFRNPAETLGPTLKRLSDVIIEKQVELNFCDLSFMNSSAVTPILMFVKGLLSKGSQIHLIYNGKLSWQRTTASAMRALSHSLKNLSVTIAGD